jgi:uncharacterized protein
VSAKVLWDSSAILALLDARDRHHEAAVRIATELAGRKAPCFITNYVEVEAHALLLCRVGRSVARQWVLSGALPVVRALPQDEDRARELIARHDDKDWSLCDAISFAMSDRLGVKRAFSFDHHFGQLGRLEVLGLSR